MTYKECQTDLIRHTAAQQTDNKHISYPKAILYAFFRFYQYFCDSVKEILTAYIIMENKKTQLPENAHRELKPGEEYQPLLSPQKTYPEVTPWSGTIGLIMTVIFSAAAAYLGLKVGQVFEAAIPIAIIAVGLST